MGRFNEWVQLNKQEFVLNEAAYANVIEADQALSPSGTIYPIASPEQAIQITTGKDNVWDAIYKQEWAPHKGNYRVVTDADYKFTDRELVALIQYYKNPKNSPSLSKLDNTLFDACVSENFKDFQDRCNDISKTAREYASRSMVGYLFGSGGSQAGSEFYKLVKLKGWKFFGYVVGYLNRNNYLVPILPKIPWYDSLGMGGGAGAGGGQEGEGYWGSGPLRGGAPGEITRRDTGTNTGTNTGTGTGRGVDPRTGTYNRRIPATTEAPKESGDFGFAKQQVNPIIAKYQHLDLSNNDNSFGLQSVARFFDQRGYKVYYDPATNVILVKQLTTDQKGNIELQDPYFRGQDGQRGVKEMVRFYPENDQPSGRLKALMQAYEKVTGGAVPPQMADAMWRGVVKNNGQPITRSDDVVILNRPTFRGETLQNTYPDKKVFHSSGAYDPNTGELDKRQQNVTVNPAPYYTDKNTGQKIYYPKARGYIGQ